MKFITKRTPPELIYIRTRLIRKNRVKKKLASYSARAYNENQVMIFCKLKLEIVKMFYMTQNLLAK